MRPTVIRQRHGRGQTGPEFAHKDQRSAGWQTTAVLHKQPSKSKVTHRRAGSVVVPHLRIARSLVLTSRLLVAPRRLNRPRLVAAIQRRTNRAAILRSPSGSLPDALELSLIHISEPTRPY